VASALDDGTIRLQDPAKSASGMMDKPRAIFGLDAARSTAASAISDGLEDPFFGQLIAAEIECP